MTSPLKSGAARRTVRSAPAWLLAGAALLLAGCDRNGDKTAGQQLDTAIAETEQAARAAKATTEQLAADAKAKLDEKVPEAQAALKDGADKARAMAQQAGRGIEAATDDASITAAVSAGLAKDPDLSALRIDVDTQAGVVSLKGPAPTAAAKARAEQIAREVQGVQRVNNALEVRAM